MHATKNPHQLYVIGVLNTFKLSENCARKMFFNRFTVKRTPKLDNSLTLGHKNTHMSDTQEQIWKQWSLLDEKKSKV